MEVRRTGQKTDKKRARGDQTGEIWWCRAALSEGKPRSRSQGGNDTALPMPATGGHLLPQLGSQTRTQVNRGQLSRLGSRIGSQLGTLHAQGRRMLVTRHTTLPTSSATSSPPLGSTATPTGRPQALPSGLTKPVNTSIGKPVGWPLANGTNTTL